MLAIRRGCAEFIGYDDASQRFQNALNNALTGVTTDNFKDFQFGINNDTVHAAVYYGDEVTTGTQLVASVLQLDVRGYNDNLATVAERTINAFLTAGGLEAADIKHFSYKISDKAFLAIIIHV
jgi:hypothetical protein